MENRETGPITIRAEAVKISQSGRDDASGQMRTRISFNTKANSTLLGQMLDLIEGGTPLAVTFATDQVAMQMLIAEEEVSDLEQPDPAD